MKNTYPNHYKLKKKQFKVAVTFLTAYNGIFNVTNKNKKFYFAKSITDEDAFIHITIPPGAYEFESLNNETRRIIIEERHFTEVDYPFTINQICPHQIVS